MTAVPCDRLSLGSNSVAEDRFQAMPWPLSSDRLSRDNGPTCFEVDPKVASVNCCWLKWKLTRNYCSQREMAPARSLWGNGDVDFTCSIAHLRSCRSTEDRWGFWKWTALLVADCGSAKIIVRLFCRLSLIRSTITRRQLSMEANLHFSLFEFKEGKNFSWI